MYWELCLEFFSTVSFQGGDDFYIQNDLTFYLVGEYRECSIAELGWRLGIYDESEVMTEAFGLFLENSHKDLLEVQLVQHGGTQ